MYLAPSSRYCRVFPKISRGHVIQPSPLEVGCHSKTTKSIWRTSTLLQHLFMASFPGQTG